MNAIEVIDLKKKYKERTAVNGISFSVAEGELFSLLGVNGAGKTTTIKMLSCLLSPTSGDALLEGKSVVTDPFSVKKIINVSPQETAVARNLSVRENLELIAGIYGFDRKTQREKATEMIEIFGLSEYEKSKAKTLSGGTQRRLSIAMALISDPSVLFLDEPTLGLDVIARRELWRAVENLKGKKTIILTTHYMEEAEALSDKVAVMVKGSIKAIGTPAELIETTGAKNFEDAFVALASEEVL